MRILKLMAFAAISVFATSCNDGKTKISGNVKADVEEIAVFSIDPSGTEPLDTFEVKDHKFGKELRLDTADFILLRITDNYGVPLFVQPGEKVQVELDGNDTDPTYEVSGSEESERILEISKIRLAAFEKIDSLNNIGEKIKGSRDYMLEKEKLDTAFQKVVKNTTRKYKDMIDEKPGSIANIFIFSQTIGNFPLISAQEDFEYFEKVDSGIAVTYPNLRHTKNFHQSMKRLRESIAMQKKMEEVKKNLEPGKEIPEIALSGPDGEVKKLSDLRGKVVLVDFWAAWCRPCRAQNPFLVKLYNQYRDQGFDVYSVSLDGLPQQQNPKAEWTAAIEQDGLVWDHHVSELQGWDSEVIMDFGFNGIPFTILIDREGKIVATELRGPQLEAKVKETLGS